MAFAEIVGTQESRGFSRIDKRWQLFWDNIEMDCIRQKACWRGQLSCSNLGKEVDKRLPRRAIDMSANLQRSNEYGHLCFSRTLTSKDRD